MWFVCLFLLLLLLLLLWFSLLAYEEQIANWRFRERERKISNKLLNHKIFNAFEPAREWSVSKLFGISNLFEFLWLIRVGCCQKYTRIQLLHSTKLLHPVLMRLILNFVLFNLHWNSICDFYGRKMRVFVSIVGGFYWMLSTQTQTQMCTH